MKKVVKSLFDFLAAFVALCYSLCGMLKEWFMKIPKFFRWLFIFLLAVFITAIAVSIACEYHYRVYGKIKWNDRVLSDECRVCYYRNHKHRVYNVNSREYTTPKLDFIWGTDNAEDSLTVYANDGKRGFININTGKIVIDAKDNDYKKAWLFSEGLAAVVKGEKIGFINPQNELVIPFRPFYKDNLGRKGVAYLFHNGYCIMTNEKGKVGLIDKSGNWTLEPKYDEVWLEQYRGCRIVVDSDRYGVLDSLNNFIYPLEYSDIEIIPDGFIFTKDGRRWQTDINGNTVKVGLYDYSYALKYPIAINELDEMEFELSDYSKYNIGEYFGLMERNTGKIITPAIYREIDMLSRSIVEIVDYNGNRGTFRVSEK